MAVSPRDLLAGRGRVVAVIVAVAFVAAAGITGGLIAASGPSANTYTALFSEAVGVYPGSNVDVLGVPVGTIDSVTPVGKQVKVTFSVDSNVSVPALADALVIVPSVVADRYIQLSPAYTSGPTLTPGDTIPATRTATPVEVDQLYNAITKFSSDLGPNGVNSHGALNDVINTGAKNLKGNGRAFGTMIRDLGQLYQTLQNSQGNFFGTITNLEKFTAMLNSNSGQVAQAQNQLAQVSGFLAADRSELGGALNELSAALAQVQNFINTNKSALTTNITRLQAITRLLVNQKASISHALDEFPLAADNVLSGYDPSTGTLDGRGDLNEISMGRCSYITNPAQHGCPVPINSAGASALPLPPTGTAIGGSGQ